MLTGTYTGETISAQLLPSGKIFIASGGSASNLFGTIVSINGTTISQDKTATLVSDSTAFGWENIETALLGDNTVFITHNYDTGYQLYGIVCTISGTTVTVGTDTALCTTNYSSASSIVPLGNDKVFITHAQKSSDYYHLYGMVCTVSGTTISKGGNTKLNGGNSCGNSSTVAINNEKVFIAYGNGSYLCGMVCKIDGATITAGTATSLNTNEYTGYLISALLLEDNVFIGHK